MAAKKAKPTQYNGVTIRRYRQSDLKLSDENQQRIVDRVLRMYSSDIIGRTEQLDARIQRHAKKRMWREGKSWPWEGASDQGLPDLMMHSLKAQDTLVNAVMSARPVMTARYLQAPMKYDQELENGIDDLLDYQIFIEQNGELAIGELAQDFIDDGQFTCLIPWVREYRKATDLRVFPRLSMDSAPMEQFKAILQLTLQPKADPEPVDQQGWEWDVESINEKGEQETMRVCFYTRESDDAVEMVIRRTALVYDGPRMIPYGWHRVLHPPRAANLQAPSSANPGGAAHAILVDWPIIDEIDRLRRSGFYDLVTKEQVESMKSSRTDTGVNDEFNREFDVFEGTTNALQPVVGAEDHRKLTLLMCFDVFDIDGDGEAEDCIFWVIRETKTLLKVVLMTDLFPAMPPRRPLAEAQFIRVNGRRIGIGLLELCETLHDFKKTITDQGVDAGTLSNIPFFFYRAAGTTRPETIRLWPGEGYPVGDPSKDVKFPKFNNYNSAFTVNTLAMIDQSLEKLLSQGDLQFGQVPLGQASALRTTSNMQLMHNIGEARPEHILRNFFNGLKEVYQQALELNQRFLPEAKRIRLLGERANGKDPFKTIQASQLQGRYTFDFGANVFNTSRSALQAALGDLLGKLASPLMLQLQITTPDTLFKVMRDYVEAMGQDSKRYVNPPTPQANRDKYYAEEVTTAIMAGFVPDGDPAETGGWPEHIQKLEDLAQDQKFGVLSPQGVQLFSAYLAKARGMAAQAAQQQQLLQAAQQFQQQIASKNPGGRPAQLPGGLPGQPPVSGPGELLNEQLPTAGGGANAARTA